MKYLVLILFLTFVSDTVKIDTVNKQQIIQANLDEMKNDLDSIKIILDSLKNQKK